MAAIFDFFGYHPADPSGTAVALAVLLALGVSGIWAVAYLALAVWRNRRAIPILIIATPKAVGVVLLASPMIAGALLLIAAAIATVRGALAWFITGLWPSELVSTYMAEMDLQFPRSSWYGIQQIFIWCARQDLTVFSWLAGGALFMGGLYPLIRLADWQYEVERRRKQQARSKQFHTLSGNRG